MIGWRKVLFGAWAFGLTWAWLMWGPNLSEKDKAAGLVLQGTIVTAVVGMNGYEHRQKRKAAESGAGQALPPGGPGGAPAAGMEGAPAAGGPLGETERGQ